MLLQSLLYVSRSTIAATALPGAVEEIVARARERNTQAGLTGALLFTGTHFAQVLEGCSTEIEAMVARLRRDPRHQQMVVVDHRLITHREFEGWNLAYYGSSQFVSRRVAQLMESPSMTKVECGGIWLIMLMREFTLYP